MRIYEGWNDVEDYLICKMFVLLGVSEQEHKTRGCQHNGLHNLQIFTLFSMLLLPPTSIISK